MNIKINQLILQNFKGIKSLEINASGENLTIYGDNATGKTTIFDAFTWLLFGKDSLGRSDFGIKTQDEYGNALHNLEHSVECELLIDETILNLKKVFTEKWTKKRGSAEAEFSGHETKYYINEVPSTKGEYTAKITGIVDENLFKIITNPLYFNEHMKWQDRRAILLNLCENINDDEIIANNDKFSPLLNELKGRTVQEYKKIIQVKQSAINDDLKTIPQRISEATLAIPATIAEVDESEKAIIEQRIAELNNEIVAVKNDSGTAELNALKEKRLQIEKSACDTSELHKALLDANLHLKDTENDIRLCRQEIANINNSIAEYEADAEELRKEWHEVNDKQYTDSGMCPTCGQKLPDEQIADAKAKFNINRAAKLELITAIGKQKKTDIENAQKLRLETAAKLDRLLKSAALYTAETERLTAEIEEKKTEFQNEKEKKLATLDLLIAENAKNTQNQSESVQARIYTIQEHINVERLKLSEINKGIAERELKEKQLQRIKELEADEKRLAGEYANLEKTAFLIDEFIKFKVELLSEAINNHFKYAKFKLFDVQINGGIAECCEVMYKGVPYSDLNNASKINTGLDIINTLCTMNDKYAPIIVDNAESITNILPTTSQMVCLVVSAGDDMLRIEKNI